MASPSALLRTVNVVGSVLSSFGLHRTFDPDRLIRAARRDAKLEDFGGDDFREPLDLITRDAEATGLLTFFGRHVLYNDLRQRLTNRLRIVDLLRRDPAILESPIDRPIVIVGLPRTGSTLLQRLLAVDPSNRTPRTWEMNEPVPPPTEATYASDPRMERGARDLVMLNRLNPRLRAIHDLDIAQPEECIALMANDLVSGWFMVAYHLPSYFEWFHRADMLRPYEHHRRQLQILQHRFRRERWVLKAPHHLHGLDALLRVYPDARVVWTHRDPAEAIASAASLLVEFRSTLNRHIDAAETGRLALEVFASYSRRGRDARASAAVRFPDARFVDVDYRELVRAPLGIVERLYRELDIPFSPKARTEMEQYLSVARQHRFGRHDYSLEAFGLTSDAVKAAFAD